MTTKKYLWFAIVCWTLVALLEIARADPKDLDPNAHPLPPQAIGSSAGKGATPPMGQMPRAAQTVSPTAEASPAPSAGPCVRGQSSVRLAGIDVDELKCELAVVRLERNAAQERLEKILAAGSLVSSDLATTRENVKNRDAALAEWFKGYFGEPPK